MLPLSQRLEEVVYQLCVDTNTPRSLAIWLMVKNKEFGQLVGMTIDPAHYDNPSTFRADNSCTELLRKFQGFTIPGVDKEAAAHKSFWDSERTCARTNLRLSRYLHNGPFEDPADVAISNVIDMVKRKIALTLGSIPKDLIGARFGPGATFADVGKLTTVPDKITSQPTVTQGARCILPLWERTAWCRARIKSRPTLSDPLTVRGNRFTTVPKDAQKDRGIAIEPSINVFYQLGVGAVIRQRLHRVGVDLDYGQDLHRALAREASRKGHLATIDLSNASDTVCKVLVKLLLPTEWHDLLDSLRSSFTRVNESWVFLEKFSSMGNGFTFELETLIFQAIMEVSCELSKTPALPGKDLLVYGDDIIIPTNAAKTALSLLRYLGFTPNVRKTYTEGLFRESCGGDYFDGAPVRAHYLKEHPNEPQEWVALANGLKRLESEVCPIRFSFSYGAWRRCLEAIPTSIRRLRGPERLGDIVLHDDDCQSHVIRVNPRRPWQREIRTYRPVPNRLGLEHWAPDVIFASVLYGVGPTVTPRGDVAGYRITWMAYP